MNPWVYLLGAVVTVVGGALLTGQYRTSHRARDSLDKESAILERLPEGPAKLMLAEHIHLEIQRYVEAAGSRTADDETATDRGTSEDRKGLLRSDVRPRPALVVLGWVMAVVPVTALAIGVISYAVRIDEPYDLTGGGCPGNPFTGYAATEPNWSGADIRKGPYGDARLIGSLIPDETAEIDGWVTSSPGYPDAFSPYNTTIWFHVVGKGWVSGAQLRGQRSGAGNSALLVGLPECAGWWADNRSDI